jgi:nitrile hydratase subunit beta
MTNAKTLGAGGCPLLPTVYADGATPLFERGDAIRILNRSPIGHYRVPIYLRGKIGTVEAVIEPTGVNNEEEGFGRNAGSKLHYYRIAVPLSQVWSHYNGSSQDSLRIEVFESWLEGT